MATEIKTIDDCTEMQRKFIAALTSQEISEQPKKSRWRWAARQAGYSESLPISQILKPIQHLLKDVAQLILDRASIEASWQLADAAGDGAIDAQTKDRISASKDILDRVVPKKDANVGKESKMPVAVVILPTKTETIKIEEGVYREIESVEKIPAV